MSLSNTIIQLFQQIAQPNCTAEQRQAKTHLIKRVIKEGMTEHALFYKREGLEIQPEDTLSGHDNSGLNPLMYLIKSNITGPEFSELFELMIKGLGEHVAGTPLTLIDNEGFNVLHHAALEGSSEAVSSLLPLMSPELLQQPTTGLTSATPSLLALARARADVFAQFASTLNESTKCTIIQHGNNVTLPAASFILNRSFLKENYPVFKEAKVTDEDIVASLRLLNPNLLHQAAQFSNAINIFFTNNSGTLPLLCFAITNGLSKSVQFLIEHGALKTMSADSRHECYEYALGRTNVYCFPEKELSLDERIKTLEVLIKAEEKSHPELLKEIFILAYQLKKVKTGLQMIARMPQFTQIIEEAFLSGAVYKKEEPFFLDTAMKNFLIEEKCISQDCVNKALLIAIGDDHSRIPSLLECKLPPDKDTQNQAMKNLLNWFSQGNFLQVENSVIPLLKSCVDPLIKNDKGLTIFELIIERIESNPYHDPYTPRHYPELQEMLKLPCIKQNENAREFCNQLLKKAVQNNNHSLVFCFTGCGWKEPDIISEHESSLAFKMAGAR